MTVSRLRINKSETRDMAERDRVWRRVDEPTEWNVSNRSFFAAFVVIAAVLAVIALVMH